MNIEGYKFGWGDRKGGPLIATFIHICAQFLSHNQLHDRTGLLLSSYLKFSNIFLEVRMGVPVSRGRGCGKDSEKAGVASPWSYMGGFY